MEIKHSACIVGYKLDPLKLVQFQASGKNSVITVNPLESCSFGCASSGVLAWT